MIGFDAPTFELEDAMIVMLLPTVAIVTFPDHTPFENVPVTFGEIVLVVSLRLAVDK